MHNFYLRYGREKVPPALKEGEERVWMGDTKLEMTQLMFPQHRKYAFVLRFSVANNADRVRLFSIHHKVFGGSFDYLLPLLCILILYD